MICSYCIDEILINDCAVSKDGKWFHGKSAPGLDHDGPTSCWALSEHGTKTLYHPELNGASGFSSHDGVH
jgi:hypothetical protein